MKEGDGNIESSNVIGHQVDHLAHAGLGKSFWTQFEAFSIDEGTKRDPHLHAYVVKLEIVEVVGEDGQRRAQNDPSSVEVGGARRHVAAWIEVAKQLGQAKRLADSKIILKYSFKLWLK